MRKLIGSALLLAALALTAGESVAQRRPAPRRAAAPAPAQRASFGAELAYGTDTDFGLGARVVFGLRSLFPRTPLDAHVGFLYFFPDAPTGVDVTYWEINGNIAYRIPNVRGSLAPYLGGGLNIAHASASSGGLSASDTKLGLNLLGGTTFKVKGTVIPFVEARGIISGGEQFVISGGMRFSLR
ncbi:MAG TPA: hypothetical protein VFU41_08225 [Gemmatimonadales bacterium]|nr:hypothetical protein [Gemmatimonadales bacterium]